MPTEIRPPFYPIVYVRGYAMRNADREETFHDAYYGFAETSVEKRQAPKPHYIEPDIFEGQFIRFMKEHGYADACNRGLEQTRDNPSKSIWICRFYDRDYIQEKLRSIEEHAEDLRKLICEDIPARLKACGMDLGENDADFRVILMAHSMGGLVCRTLIQNLLPAKQEDPKRWIHRLVTVGTPHGGIELGSIPDFVENFVTSRYNPFDANIFKEERMREYLHLDERQPIHGLGRTDVAEAYPPSRCFCLVGSDHGSYNAVRHVTGHFSDGLVKQDRAYIKDAYWANVHRAHSGRRGIVNSYESYENIQRFLFGDTRVYIELQQLKVRTDEREGSRYFYDVEFLLSVRGTGVYLHRREQDPCENAIRRTRAEMSAPIRLHTGFLDSTKRSETEPFSHFALTVRIQEREIKDGFLWDHQYPSRPIFNETLEVRVGDVDPATPGQEAEFRWLSDGSAWKKLPAAEAQEPGVFRIPLRSAKALFGTLCFQATPWNQSDPELAP
ncbi:MAG: esterase/lipase family protein [Actinomycetota bacterium]